MQRLPHKVTQIRATCPLQYTINTYPSLSVSLVYSQYDMSSRTFSITSLKDVHTLTHPHFKVLSTQMVEYFSPIFEPKRMEVLAYQQLFW